MTSSSVFALILFLSPPFSSFLRCDLTTAPITCLAAANNNQKNSYIKSQTYLFFHPRLRTTHPITDSHYIYTRLRPPRLLLAPISLSPHHGEAETQRRSSIYIHTQPCFCLYHYIYIGCRSVVGFAFILSSPPPSFVPLACIMRVAPLWSRGLWLSGARLTTYVSTRILPEPRPILSSSPLPPPRRRRTARAMTYSYRFPLSLFLSHLPFIPFTHAEPHPLPTPCTRAPPPAFVPIISFFPPDQSPPPPDSPFFPRAPYPPGFVWAPLSLSPAPTGAEAPRALFFSNPPCFAFSLFPLRLSFCCCFAFSFFPLIIVSSLACLCASRTLVAWLWLRGDVQPV